MNVPQTIVTTLEVVALGFGVLGAGFAANMDRLLMLVAFTGAGLLYAHWRLTTLSAS
jgi:hypothetical protein